MQTLLFNSECMSTTYATGVQTANATAYAIWMQTRLFYRKTPQRYLWEWYLN
jgi:hypothetical protein